ncbi:MAG: hypothetical protein K2Y23_09180 [Cyanobacteria bacterium]|nr:hypothetical protein [Cyanobacteriota bacterium]
MEPAGGTFVDLEFDTGTRGGALLGDIATSLVSLDELLRDLASLAAEPSTAEYRNVEIVAIEMRSPLKIRLSPFGISADALAAFQEICRDIILGREFSTPAGVAARITEQETRRLRGHVVNLRNAVIPLKRVETKT